MHTQNSSPDAGREGPPTGNGPACLGPFQDLPASGSEPFPPSKDTDEGCYWQPAVFSPLRSLALDALRQRFRLEDACIHRRPLPGRPPLDRLCPTRTPTRAAGLMPPVRLAHDPIRLAAVRCRPSLSTSSSDPVVISPQLPVAAAPPSYLGASWLSAHEPASKKRLIQDTHPSSAACLALLASRWSSAKKPPAHYLESGSRLLHVPPSATLTAPLGLCLAHSTRAFTTGPPSKCTGLSSFAAPHSSRKCRARPLSAHDRLRWLFGDHAGCDSPLLSCQGISLSSRQASHPSFIQNPHLPFGLGNGAAAFLTLELPMDVLDLDELISLQKTLCAMRWIALMKCDQAVAETIAANMAFVHR